MFSGAVAILTEAATNGARKSINQNISNLRTEVYLEEEEGERESRARREAGMTKG